MNEKELAKMCNKSTNDCIELAKQLKEAQDRIDKAIEYIEKDNFNCKNQEEQIKFKTDLLNILRGKDNDSK